MRRGAAARATKRLLDVLVAAIALLILSPVMLVAWALVRIRMGKPAFFRQRRIGEGGREFTVLKFRTMNNETEGSGRPLPDELRLSGMGAWLRRMSVDELPQLLNVLRGHMSLVGPRPLLAQYLPRYNAVQRRRHEVKPGITGWAQVRGRNALTWEEKFQLDVWYVDHWSLWLDLRILGLTLWSVIRRQGISQEGHATMREFMGSSGG
jgi:lipopolysaccharide/colanic/teichoic acid biosynthesis glycosyltransferase